VRLPSIRTAIALAVVAVSATAVGAGATPSAPAAPARPHLVYLPQLHGSGDAVKAFPGGNDAAGNLIYRGGTIFRRPKIYLILWHWPSTTHPGAVRLINFFKGTGGSGWQGVTTQYFQGRGKTKQYVTNPRNQLAGAWFDSAAIHDDLSDAEVAREAARGVAHFGSRPDPNALYMVATPPNNNDAGFNQHHYCAYHGYTTTRTNPGITPHIAYSNLPYIPQAGVGCGAYLVNDGSVGYYDGLTMAAGHEYLEAVTDPGVGNDGNGGWYDVLGQENADKCIYITSGPGKAHNVHWSTGTFAVQTTWSNRANAHTGACRG
jgi:serine protease